MINHGRVFLMYEFCFFFYIKSIYGYHSTVDLIQTVKVSVKLAQSSIDLHG